MCVTSPFNACGSGGNYSLLFSLNWKGEAIPDSFHYAYLMPVPPPSDHVEERKEKLTFSSERGRKRQRSAMLPCILPLPSDYVIGKKSRL